jgi:ribosomal-protein-alanine N-acetyltransferase
MAEPTLHTTRLLLRPFTPADAPEVQRLAGQFAIADTTLAIPHPYPDGAAEAWIREHAQHFIDGQSAIFAITDKEQGHLLGAIGLERMSQHRKAEMGYWIRVSLWNRGYCTEAALAVLAYAFDVLDINKVVARHFSRNPASGRVMQKIGMRHEGTLRQDVIKWGRPEDIELYAILRQEYFAIREAAE